MDIRYTTSPYIDMDDLAKLWEVNRRLSYEVIERESGVYKNIEDNYPKYVISTDTFDMSQNGIIHKNIIDWLLDR